METPNRSGGLWHDEDEDRAEVHTQAKRHGQWTDPRDAPLSRVGAGDGLVIGEDVVAGGVWTIPPGATEPESFSPLTEGLLVLSEAGTEPGSPIAGSFSGPFVGVLTLTEGWGATAAVYPGPAID